MTITKTSLSACRAAFLWVGAALALSLAAPLALAQALPPGMTQVTSVEGITEYRLANGLQVLLVPDSSKPDDTPNAARKPESSALSNSPSGTKIPTATIEPGIA
jgi:zinc protease